MPNKATVSGSMMDASMAPIAGGKIVATLNGADYFDAGIKIVTQRVETTTDANGEWSLDLIVNGEGDLATSSWSIEGYNNFVTSVFKSPNLFIAAADPTTLSDLEKVSAANLAAAKSAALSRFITVSTFAEYEAIPDAQKKPTDIVLVTGV